MATLRKMMRIIDEGEPYTIGADCGEGWLFYFDGKERPGRKHFPASHGRWPNNGGKEVNK